MKNIKEVAKLISQKKRKIVIFADSDLDGVSSSIILKKSIEAVGGSVSVYISNIEEWGRGLTPKAVSFMQKEAPALLITLDCGISNFEGVEDAKKAGFSVIIIDHHDPFEKLPVADIILNPKQKDDDYPFKNMANVGVTFSLTKEILKEKFLLFRRSFLEITALATVADMVPREEDNKKILDEGLLLLEKPQLPALRVLKERIEEDFVQKAVSLLNITEMRGSFNDCFLFLSAEDEETARNMLEELFEAKKKREKEISAAIESVTKNISEDDVIVFEGGSFPSYFCGTIAFRIIKNFKRPTFIYAKGEETSRGSVRVPSGINAIEAMSFCSEYLLDFGGHPPAAGFVVSNSNLDNFKNCLINYFK